MAQLLYLHDSYLKAFDATVEGVQGQVVALDRTAFYAGGGGQPVDVGTLRWSGGECRVMDVRKDGDAVWHMVEGALPAVGAAVAGALDWNRRYAIMRHHSALHVLVGVVYRQFNALVTGGAIYPDRARMDFSLEDLNKDRVAAIEAEANRVIGEHRRVPRVSGGDLARLFALVNMASDDTGMATSGTRAVRTEPMNRKTTNATISMVSTRVFESAIIRSVWANVFTVLTVSVRSFFRPRISK